MWERWRRIGPIGWAFVALICVGVFQFYKEQNVPKEIEAASKERAAVGPAPADASLDPNQSASSPESVPFVSNVPPTATVDGVTYTGEQQIEAMIQAARDAGLDEATAQRTGREAAIICNGNPDCLR